VLHKCYTLWCLLLKLCLFYVYIGLVQDRGAQIPWGQFAPGVFPKRLIIFQIFNTSWTGDADLRLYITTVQDGWRKSAFITHPWFPRTIDLITQYMEHLSEWFCWRMFTETRVFGQYFLKISIHKNIKRICYKFLKKHSIKVDLNCLDPGNVHLNKLNAPVLNVLTNKQKFMYAVSRFSG